MPQTKEEILRQRLFRALQLPLWLFPTLVAVGIAMFPLHAFPSWVHMKEIYTYFGVGHAVLLLLIYQAIVLGWIYKLRQTLPTATPAQARRCYIGNILFGIASFILLPACAFLLQSGFGVAVGLVTAVLSFLPLAHVNRLLSALYNKADPVHLASPCPTVFNRWDSAKSSPIAPLIAIVITAFLFLLYYLLEPFIGEPWIALIGCAGVAFAFTAATLLVILPFLFLLSSMALSMKQTATPSAGQRLIRKVVWAVIEPKNSFPDGEEASFRWWLSHPGQPWPENMEKIAPYIDTTSFDWQNPNAWDVPLEQAAREAQKAQKTLVSKDLPVLSIGSQAQEAAQKIAQQPVTRITPLFQAILSQDVSAVQKLLPSGELNRPFAGTGNTPLHVAALNGYTNIVRLLLEQPGIDTTRTNNESKTALDLAREKGFTEIVLLLENNH